MKVDYATMDLARQLMERQADGHLPAMRGMISSWGTLSDSDLGLILQRLKPINDAIVHEGDKVLGKIEEVYSLGSSNMKATLEAYLRADEAAYCEVQKVASEMGVQLPTYKDPRDSFSSLGAAEQTAPPFYSGGDPDLPVQAFQDGYRSGTFVREQLNQILDRIGETFSADRGLRETVDPQTFLVTPTGSLSEIENLRWSAGIVLGSVDWVFEQIFGFSLLDEVVYKPFAGDWNRVQQASEAWTHVGGALGAVSQNTTGMLPAMAEWTGRGSEAFLRAATVIADADSSLASSAAGAVSVLISGLAILVKEISKAIGRTLETIANFLITKAAEAATPVAGWAVA